jgi:hypothetical protein
MDFKFICPDTGDGFSSHVQLNGRIVARYWGKEILLPCPHCSGMHAFNFKQHYIDAALAAGDIQEVPTSTL